MYLAASQLKLLGRIMQTLAEPHEEADIRARVGELMLDLLGAQYYASYVWDGESRTFDRRVQINMDPANLLQYERYFQYHDPITPRLQQHRRAVRIDEVMARAPFVRTEFFNDFLARDGLHWGINLYAWQGARNIGDMRIWRDRRHEDFGDNDKQLLDLIRPAFVAALLRCRPPSADVATFPTESATADWPAGAVSLGRASSPSPAFPALSERERDVANLAACGLADKEIARRLGIAPTTVRSHIDNAFRKLGVNNRVALAHKLRT